MDGLLSLKWKNHCSTFLELLVYTRNKQLYTDVTLACSGELYHAHKLILSACSDYFRKVFDHTDCKNPVIILKDIDSKEMEALLDYMYIGEVNVHQKDLASLIKAAECLQIKGLAIVDDQPKKNINTKSIKNFHYSDKRKFEEESNHDSIAPSGMKIFKVDPSLSNENENQSPDDCVDNIKEENVNYITEITVDKEEEQDNLETELYDSEEPTTSKFDMTNSSLSEAGIHQFDLNKERNYPPDNTCPHCFKKFTASSSLVRHIRIHTGIKEYSCNICTYSVNRKDSLNRHMYITHNVLFLSKKNQQSHGS